MKLGAFDYLLKPLELHQVREIVGRALAVSRAMHVPTVVAGEGPVDERADLIIARCPAMQEVVKAVGRVADKDVTVLITGASGTGKELIARALYQHSRRAAGPFLAVNCAAIPETLLESELFGHEKGAFTGADRRRIGKFEQCHGGTLFLDEIGDMTPLTQSKMLRVLQEQRFERLGGNETIRTDARVLAATNLNLEAAVAAGRFRQDLYYRLSVFAIALPPLRERGEDLPLLVHHYVRRYSRELGKGVTTVAPETMELLRRQSWPGNVRELQSVLLTALLHASGPVLLPQFLPPAPAVSQAPTAGSDLERFIEARLGEGGAGLVRGSGAEAGANAAAARAGTHPRQSAARGQDPRHHARQPAHETAGTRTAHRPQRRRRRRPFKVRGGRAAASVVAPGPPRPCRRETPPCFVAFLSLASFDPCLRRAARASPGAGFAVGWADTLHRPETSPMSTATILLVDDDEVLSQVLRRVLTREGYEVIEAGSIAQALEAARLHPPLLGLLDLSLPDGDGIELARKLRAEGANCPFILVTAYPLRLRDQPELSGAFTRILTKPLNLEELRQAIEAALAGPVIADAAPIPATVPVGAPRAGSGCGGAPDAGRAAPRFQVRGLVLGGVILAGVVFFALLVLLPALGLPGLLDWFGKTSAPTAAASEAPAATLVEGDPNSLRMAPDVAAGLGVRTTTVDRPATMETLTLSGALNFDPEYLTHVHPLFSGEVVEVGPYEPEQPTSPGDEKRPLRFGDRVRQDQLLAILWSKDLGEKKNDLVEGLAKLWTDQESLTSLEELYRDLATSEANVRLQRSAVAADLSGVDRARNALRIWRVSEAEIADVERKRGPFTKGASRRSRPEASPSRPPPTGSAGPVWKCAPGCPAPSWK